MDGRRGCSPDTRRRLSACRPSSGIRSACGATTTSRRRRDSNRPVDSPSSVGAGPPGRSSLGRRETAAATGGIVVGSLVDEWGHSDAPAVGGFSHSCAWSPGSPSWRYCRRPQSSRSCCRSFVAAPFGSAIRGAPRRLAQAAGTAGRVAVASRLTEAAAGAASAPAASEGTVVTPSGSTALRVTHRGRSGRRVMIEDTRLECTGTVVRRRYQLVTISRHHVF